MTVLTKCALESNRQMVIYFNHLVITYRGQNIDITYQHNDVTDIRFAFSYENFHKGKRVPS